MANGDGGSDYSYELDEYDENLRRMLRWILKHNNRQLPKDLLEQSDDEGRDSYTDRLEGRLATEIRAIPKHDAEKFLYDGHNKAARELADWWEDYLAGEKRAAAERRKRKRLQKVKKSAISKLTKEELRALRETE